MWGVDEEFINIGDSSAVRGDLIEEFDHVPECEIDWPYCPGEGWAVPEVFEEVPRGNIPTGLQMLEGEE